MTDYLTLFHEMTVGYLAVGG